MHYVDIIVINWNSGRQTYSAIKPYLNYESTIISCKIIIVDNGSEDDSVQYLKGRVPLLIENNVNAGFAKACNIAYKHCRGDFILLLNPDTISSASTLEALVLFLVQHKKYGITGPLQFNGKNEILKSCGRFPTALSSIFRLTGLSKILPSIFPPDQLMLDWAHDSDSNVDHVMGSYMLIRTAAIPKGIFMDERFFVYMEDLDLSKRIHNNGFKTFFNSKVSIIHEGGNTGKNEYENRLFYDLDSRKEYWNKYFNKQSYYILIFISVTVEPLLRVIAVLFSSKSIRVRQIASAYYRYFKRITNFLIF